jgi:hypothetical protein
VLHAAVPGTLQPGGETAPVPNGSNGVEDMSWIWLNIPLCVLVVAFTVGLPAWIIAKYPDDDTDKTGQHAVAPRRGHGAAREVRRGSTRWPHPTGS